MQKHTLTCVGVSRRRAFAGVAFPDHRAQGNALSPSRPAPWTVVSTTLTVQLPTRQPDMNNIQKSERRAKRKPGDALSDSARFGAEVKQTAAVSGAGV